MGERQTILLLHGFSGSGGSWEPVIARLGQRYRAIAPDLRGHASASNRRPVTLDAVLTDLDHQLLAAGVAPDDTVTMVGYSQGGRVALHAALRLGMRVDGLVLIGASPGLADPAERAARLEADQQLAAEFAALTIGEIADRWGAVPILGGVTPEQAASARSERLRSTPAGLAAALIGLGTGALPSLWDRLGEITAPVTLVTGERDTKFRTVAEQMAARLQAATTVVVAGAGHAVQLEQPDAVAQAISTTRAGRRQVPDHPEPASSRPPPG